MGAVFRKELADYFGSRRFFMLLLIVALSALWAAYVSSQGLRASASGASSEIPYLNLFTRQGGVMPPVLFFISFFGPLLGLVLGFDAVNNERARGTLSRLLSQPVYRDAVLNGKFLAGVAVLATVLTALVAIVLGLGLRMLGFPPTGEETARILLFLAVSIVYISFWLAISMLFSVLFERVVAAAMVSLGVWLAATFLIFLVSGVVADVAVPEVRTTEQLLAHAQVQQNIQRLSPAFLYDEATTALLSPSLRSLGPLTQEQVQGAIPSPLPLGQTMQLIWPHVIGLMALMAICFVAAYVKFMREEVRA